MTALAFGLLPQTNRARFHERLRTYLAGNNKVIRTIVMSRELSFTIFTTKGSSCANSPAWSSE